MEDINMLGNYYKCSYRQLSIIEGQINRFVVTVTLFLTPPTNYNVLQRTGARLWTEFDLLLFYDSSMLVWGCVGGQ
jgi:hypothetical protein